MRIPRLYCELALSEHTEIQLSVAKSHYLQHVLRLKPGAALQVFNAEQGEFAATLIAYQGKQAQLALSQALMSQVESPLFIELAQGISRGDKMDFTLQKAVELGVNRIVPLITERCGVKLSAERWDKRWQHWQGIVMSACEQSGRCRLPEVAAPQSLTEFGAQPAHQLRLIMHPHQQHALPTAAQIGTRVTLVVGPEGGLAEAELSYLQQQGFQLCQLGPRILRTETVALAALSVLQYIAGDFSPTGN